MRKALTIDVEVKAFDVTVFQTPKYGQKRGYRPVYRNEIEGEDHYDVMYKVFRILNVKELLPENYNARYMATGDIVFIDEGMNGHYYYQLKPGGFFPIHRMYIR